LSLQGGVFYESSRPVDNANTYDLDSFLRMDLGAKYVQERANGLDIVYRINALNVTDTEYYKGSSFASINPERPLEIRASVELQF